jgi:hypothetical protein
MKQPNDCHFSTAAATLYISTVPVSQILRDATFADPTFADDDL